MRENRKKKNVRITKSLFFARRLFFVPNANRLNGKSCKLNQTDDGSVSSDKWCRYPLLFELMDEDDGNRDKYWVLGRLLIERLKAVSNCEAFLQNDGETRGNGTHTHSKKSQFEWKLLEKITYHSHFSPFSFLLIFCLSLLLLLYVEMRVVAKQNEIFIKCTYNTVHGEFLILSLRQSLERKLN